MKLPTDKTIGNNHQYGNNQSDYNDTTEIWRNHGITRPKNITNNKSEHCPRNIGNKINKNETTKRNLACSDNKRGKRACQRIKFAYKNGFVQMSRNKILHLFQRFFFYRKKLTETQ